MAATSGESHHGKLAENGHSENHLQSQRLQARICHMGSQSKLTIVLYSDDSSVRSTVITALGSRISPELPEHKVLEFATAPALRLHLDSKGPVDLFILDGEAVPEGGIGLARRLKDEVFNCPPIMVITGRVQDNWLASWSMAEGVAVHPIDPFTFAAQVAELLRTKTSNSTRA